MDTMPYEAEVALAAHKEVCASPAPSPSSGICKCPTLVLGEDPSLKPPCTCSQPSTAHTPAQQDAHDTALEQATSATEEDQKQPLQKKIRIHVILSSIGSSLQTVLPTHNFKK